MPIISDKTNDVVNNEVLNDDMLVEVTTNHVSTNTNAQNTEPTVSMSPHIPNNLNLDDAPLAPIRLNSPIHIPSYLKDYTYKLSKLHALASTSDP